jgi:Domain of unknown function (DUF4157)
MIDNATKRSTKPVARKSQTHAAASFALGREQASTAASPALPPAPTRHCSCGGGCPRCHAPPSKASLPAIVRQGVSSSGRALEADTRARMEARFGFDFGGVRIHADSAAAASATALNARAYTTGHDIVFGKDKYAPSSGAGMKLLAHELAHVVQQRGAVSTPPAVQRDVQSFDEAKARVLEELARDMPVAILSMIDSMDAPTRAQLAQDAQVTAAIKGLPPGAQAIVMRHLNRAAPAGPTAPAGAQKTLAEQIAFSTSADYADFGLNADAAQQAVTIFGQTDVANRLVNWLQNKKQIPIVVKFVARRRDLPRGKGEGAGVDGTFEREGKGYTVYVVGSNVSIEKDGTPRDQASDRDPQDMAKTLFHELLHVWFVNEAKLDRSDPFYTGHTAAVQAPTIGPRGGVYYDEPNYAPEFLAKLKEYDAEIAAKKKAAQGP